MVLILLEVDANPKVHNVIGVAIKKRFNFIINLLKNMVPNKKYYIK